ncbi:MAG TPA: hypothetical protein VG102_02830 [Candidatus Paceibacterota bacterium]|nr:hypothetical protein [Candidatus Paceibacterota bacterium]
MSSDTQWLRFRRWLDRVLPPTIILVVLLIVWQASVRILDLPPWLLPAPSDIAARFGRTNNLGYHTGMTVLEALSGFVIAAIFGISLSGGIVHSRFLSACCRTLSYRTRSRSSRSCRCSRSGLGSALFRKS